MSTKASASKTASQTDWLWRDVRPGRSAGLYGEIRPERSDAPSPFARAIQEAAAREPVPVA